ncbi:RNA/RNP complex-1-interacting phosphatase homolog [Leguminivora glycinivorella]|uniref:RNA/RNP complex-1-interacting phosphatase homolog n=1 Tax=Leguminivora glycinivorella TaxID=1035111 RepID=UPI00200DBEB9|nr:RNA/RNP complex-1-interacting phosphatase homolog [Leguminivora glycinivorella]
MSKSIPDRWIPYKACGKVIEGTRIVCFKVPLRKGVQVHNKAIEEIWDIQTLLTTLPNLGGVVDLTNTARYYNPAELREAGVLHKKILMPGRVIPPENKVTQFMDTIDEFLGKDCDTLIGVHCTHGLNRTGYMVCRYMRDRLGIQADDAISRFEKARGYKIERENYVADILGKKAPPPDVGKQDTKIKSLDNNAQEDDDSKPRHNNRWEFKSRSTRHDNWRSRDNRSGNDNDSGYRSRWDNDNQSGNGNRWANDNRPRNGNRWGNDNRPEMVIDGIVTTKQDLATVGVMAINRGMTIGRVMMT